MPNKGIPISQIRAEGLKKRQSILNCQAYNNGTMFSASDAARVLKITDSDSKAPYHILTGMVKDGLLQSHKTGRSTKYSKPGVDWLKIPWRAHSDDWVLLDESLGSL